MGPRLLGRGNRPLLRPGQAACESFNGAASVGTRKSPAGQPSDRPGRCFNGAASVGTRKFALARLAARRVFSASMGPRLLGRGNDPVQDLGVRVWSASMGPRLLGRGNASPRIQSGRGCTQLQWGRVCWDAEIAGEEGCRQTSAGASMGPRLLGRGNPGGFTWVDGSLRQLQWGRVCWDAEIRRHPARRTAAPCFNGAASVGTRK